MMGSTVANCIYLRDAIVDVAARSAFWPHLMKGRNPQIAFMVSIGHVRPEAQGQIRYDIIRCGISPEASSQVVDDVAIDPVGVIVCLRLYVLRIGRLTGDDSSNNQ
ncbi:hypothetical protein [Adlercreutzia sp. ZJ242]|uniref:hypothetical protein n=1 Tax=Adlercreutzia sp. ZJ242 TaxID=2709409 RepID=UPI0013EBB709|nr:hypothetical protein [Adlercreutzia sp. ZJ242]